MQPLFDICVDVLVEHVDCIESLWGVPDAMRVKLSRLACAKNKLDAQVRAP